MLNTNLTINANPTTPVVQPQTENCDYGVFVVQPNGALTLLVEALNANGGVVTSAMQFLGINEFLYLAIDDTVTDVRVSRRRGNGSWQVLQDSSGNAEFPASSTYRDFALLNSGASTKPFVYQSTSSQLQLSNQSGYSGSWSWESDSQQTAQGTFDTADGWQTMNLTPGNGTLTITYDNGPAALTIPVYDMTGSTVTIAGPDDTDAHPMAITPNGSDEVTVVNASGDTITAGWEGVSPNTIPNGMQSTFDTADATGEWYIDWDDTHDPKVIVKRPPVLTGGAVQKPAHPHGHRHRRSA